MSSPIHIPGRNYENRAEASMELQIESARLAASQSFVPNLSSVHHPSLLTSQDDIATSWPPNPLLRIVSPSARNCFCEHCTAFKSWDFSEITSICGEVMSSFPKDLIITEHPLHQGVSGAYFIRRVDAVLCVFKPADEEVGDLERVPTVDNSFDKHYGELRSLGPDQDLSTFQNCRPLTLSCPSPPARYDGPGSDHRYNTPSHKNEPSFLRGEGAYKEAAAYLLDHDHFAGVPQTALATCNFISNMPAKNKSSSDSIDQSVRTLDGDNRPSSGHEEEASHKSPKIGALQVHVPNKGRAIDFAPVEFSKDQVHKIAVFDIRTLNHDRHGGNILVVPSKKPGNRYDLVPIDHGYILPAVVESVFCPIWMDWSMVKEDLSPEMKAYIASLDPVAESISLNEELDGKLRLGSLRTLIISTMLLQKGVAAGLTLYQIGRLIYSLEEFPKAKPELERIISEAERAGDGRGLLFTLEISSADPSPASGSRQDPTNHRTTGCLLTMRGKQLKKQLCINLYIFKHVSNLISETLRRVADNELSCITSDGRGVRTRKALSRVRSIPNFGLGIRRPSQMETSFPLLPTDGENGRTPFSSPFAENRTTRMRYPEHSITEPIRPSHGFGSRSSMLPPLNPSAVPRNTDVIPQRNPNRQTYRGNGSESSSEDESEDETIARGESSKGAQ